MRSKSIVIILVVVLPLTRVATAWGEGRAEPDTTDAWSLSQNLKNSIKGNVTYASMKNSYSNTLGFGDNLKVISRLDIEERRYRLQDRSDNKRSWSNSIAGMVGPSIIWGANFSDSRIFNRIVSFTGVLQDFIVNTKQANATLNYIKTLPNGNKIEGRSMAAVSSNEKTFKVDKRLEGSIGAGIGYNLGKGVAIFGRGFLRNTKDRSESGYLSFGGLGGSEDSLSTAVRLKLPSSAIVFVKYERSNSNNKYIDLPRGIFLEQKLGEEELVLEEEMRNAKVFKMNARVYPIQSVELKLSAEHNEKLNDFAVAKRRFSRTVGDFIDGTMDYSLGKKTKFTFKLGKKEVLHDLGPVSVSSYWEKQNRASMNLNHSFNQHFQFNLSASVSLLQNLYINYDVNPRDRDQLSQILQLRMNSKPFPKVDAEVFLAVSSSDYVNIDRSMSESNRKETTYDFRPQFTYHLNERIEITQNYGLNIEFTDYVFTESRNFLDRNITFSNIVKAKLSRALFVEFYYGLLLRNSGSYLPESPGGDRVLRIAQEDRKDQSRIRFRYAINKHLAVIGEHEYSRRRDRAVVSGVETVFPEGGVRGGMEGKYKWAKDREISFSLQKVNRFGRFNTREQNSYWLMNSNIVYSF